MTRYIFYHTVSDANGNCKYSIHNNGYWDEETKKLMFDVGTTYYGNPQYHGFYKPEAAVKHLNIYFFDEKIRSKLVKKKTR